MSFGIQKASKIILSLAAVSLLLGCVNNPAYTALDGPRPQSSTSGGSAQSAPVRASSASTIASSSASAATQREAATRTDQPARPGHYRVQQGDTLYSIAFRFGLDYRKLALANDINHQFTIYPGQELALREAQAPVRSTLATPERASSAPAPSRPEPEARPQASSPTPPVAAAPSPQPSVTESNNSTASVKTNGAQAQSTGPLEWGWPHDGKIVRTFNPNVSDQKGVDLTGQIGDSVRAAANGIVVYAGSGLPGYGNLIILEHPGSLLSAYAFNQELLVTEKDQVTKGQVIARMGRQGDQPRLHFEIRQEGKPVDPMRYLPRR